MDTLVGLSAALGAVAGIGVIVVSIIRRKQVWVVVAGTALPYNARPLDETEC